MTAQRPYQPYPVIASVTKQSILQASAEPYHDKTQLFVYSHLIKTIRTQDEIMAKTIRLTPALTTQYQQLFASCTVLPQHRASVERLTAQLLQHQARYEHVAHKTHLPWPVIAVIHALEANQNFHRHPHNGDPLHSRTVNVPAHRPLTLPPFTWEASAIDAMHYSGLAQWHNWSIAGSLFKLEAYNGWGYRRYHPQVLSPYLWSFSQHYHRGKYAADGRFDPNLISKQCGAALLLKALNYPSADPIQHSLLTTNHSTLPTAPYPGRLLALSQQYDAMVKLIQQQLNHLGYQPRLKVDGYFGDKTLHAVKWFQASNHIHDGALKVDGVVGSRTWPALFTTLLL